MFLNDTPDPKLIFGFANEWAASGSWNRIRREIPPSFVSHCKMRNCYFWLHRLGRRTMGIDFQGGLAGRGPCACRIPHSLSALLEPTASLHAETPLVGSRRQGMGTILYKHAEDGSRTCRGETGGPNTCALDPRWLIRPSPSKTQLSVCLPACLPARTCILTCICSKWASRDPRNTNSGRSGPCRNARIARAPSDLTSLFSLSRRCCLIRPIIG